MSFTDPFSLARQRTFGMLQFSASSFSVTEAHNVRDEEFLFI